MRYLTAHLPPVPGEVKAIPADFQVEEVPAYPPSGQGSHLFLEVEKEGLSTFAAARRLARALGVPEGSVGYAGLKDVHARAIQSFSVEHVDPARAEGLALPGLRVLAVSRHGNKLRLGHLRGNRFRLLLRGAPPAALPTAVEVLRLLAAQGVPNLFGPQRFGLGGGNPSLGRHLLQGDRAGFVASLLGGDRPGEPWAAARARFRQGDLAGALALWPDGEERRILARLAQGASPETALHAASRRFLTLFLGALQAEVFNAVVLDRLAGGGLGGVEAGDWAWLHRNGACFLVADAAQEAPRAAALEISATGPIPGPRMLRPQGEPGRREQEILARHRVDPEAFGRLPGLAQKGARRPLRVPLGEPAAAAEAAGIRLSFTLPAGAYATVVLSEITKGGAMLDEGG